MGCHIRVRTENNGWYLVYNFFLNADRSLGFVEEGNYTGQVNTSS